MWEIFVMHGENIFWYTQKLSLTAIEFITSNISCHSGWQFLLKHLLMRPLVLDSLPNSIIAADKKDLKVLSAKVSKQYSFNLPSPDFIPNGIGQKKTVLWRTHQECTKFFKN